MPQVAAGGGTQALRQVLGHSLLLPGLPEADWKAHKKTCGKGSSEEPKAGAVRSPPKGLDQPIIKPFTRLSNGTWLHDRPEKDVYRLLIGSYRLRVEDNYNLEGDIDADSLRGGEPNGLKGFRRFMRLAGSRPGLLPPWWTAEKQRECEHFGMDSSNFQNLCGAVEKGDIIEYYRDSRFPMQLRMLAEAVYQRGPGGQNGTGMREMMAAMEQGTAGEGMSFTTIDALTGSSSTVHSAGKSQ